MEEIKPLTVYSKHCIRCNYEQELKLIARWTMEHGYALKLCRTVLDKSYHQKATELWGNEDYPAFVEMDGKVESISDFIETITKPKKKSKPVKKGKTK